MSRRALAVTVVALALMVVLDLIRGDTSPIPGYYAAIGLFGCVAIILVSKWIGKRLLQRREDYYPLDEPPDVQEDLRG